jgi:hypothetical protein
VRLPPGAGGAAAAAPASVLLGPAACSMRGGRQTRRSDNSTCACRWRQAPACSGHLPGAQQGTPPAH